MYTLKVSISLVPKDVDIEGTSTPSRSDTFVPEIDPLSNEGESEG